LAAKDLDRCMVYMDRCELYSLDLLPVPKSRNTAIEKISHDSFNNILFTVRMGDIEYMGLHDSRKRVSHFFTVAFHNCLNNIHYCIDKQIKMAELKIAWILLYVLVPPMYIYAAASNFDTWKAVFLFVLAGCTGLIALARLAIKFFKELLDVLVAYREKQVNIEGVKHLYIIIGLLITIIVLIALILFLTFK
jgi:hypothetical protein